MNKNILNISLQQQPSLITSMDNITLSSDIKYRDNDKQRELENIQDKIVYEWLYSTDNGETFKSLNINTKNLIIQLDSININFVYKLKISINRESSAITLNHSQYNNILSTDDIILLTNQELDDSEIWYSDNIKLNHSFLDMEDIIIGIALSDIVSKLGDVVDFDIDAENDTLLDNTQQNTENIPVGPPADISASNPIQTQGLISNLFLRTCYVPTTLNVCGLTIEYCTITTNFPSFAPFPCPQNPSACPSNGCELAKTTWSYKQIAGEWYNSEVGKDNFVWCSSLVKTPWTPYSGPRMYSHQNKAKCDVPDPPAGDEVQLCQDNTAPTYYNPPCASLANAKKKTGGCPGVHYLIGQYNYCNSDAHGCPGTTYKKSRGIELDPITDPDHPDFGIDIQNYDYNCEKNAYWTKSKCECDGEITSGGRCWAYPFMSTSTEDIKCERVSMPNLYYSGTDSKSGETFTVSVSSNSNYAGLIDNKFLLFGGGETKAETGTTVTLSLKGDTDAKNYSGLPETIQITVTNPSANSECDLIGFTPTSEDKWGGCFSVGAPYQCITSVPDELRCYNGDRYYTIEAAGSQDFSCKVECDKNTPATATASIYIIKPTESRPTEPNMFLTLQEAKEQLSNLNPNDPYYIRVDGIYADYTPPCEYTCKNKNGWVQKKKINIGNKAYRPEGSLSLQNACVKCGCSSHDDCDGCDACAGGNCVSYPDFSSAGQSAGLGHPCMDAQQFARGVATKECCVGTDFSGSKVISCADLKNCEFCNDGLLGQFVDKNYIPALDQACCPSPPNSTSQGTVYDTQCSKCHQYQVVDKCEPPEVCVFDDPSFSIITIDGFDYTKENKSCQIPPCPLCQRPHESYDTTGLCVPYEETEEGRECKQCEVITEINFITGESHEAEKISSTLEGVEVCCQTGETTFEPAELCCPNSNGYNHTGDRDEGCCGDTTYRLAKDCCVNGTVDAGGANGCEDCNGNPVCPPETLCCERLSYEEFGIVTSVGCANPTNCEECGGAFEGPIVVLTYDTSDPCLECNNGSVDPITSDDPDDPCYTVATPQSIFYQP